jgi:Arc/MetJ-type ribon-helix-helix transcriptional regulator
MGGYLCGVVKTLNISLTPEQVAWINSQKSERGFATASDVVRDMIREKQEQRWRRLEKEFGAMSKRDGAAGPAPVEEIVAICRRVKRKRLKQREATRGS